MLDGNVYRYTLPDQTLFGENTKIVVTFIDVLHITKFTYKYHII